MNWILQNWQGILGGGSLTTLITYLANRKSNQADFLTKVEAIYGALVDDLKSDRDNLKTEITDFKKDIRELQSQFNSIQLAYAKEVEMSQNWEKLHRELTDKYNALLKDHEELKAEFEKYKKLNKK